MPVPPSFGVLAKAAGAGGGLAFVTEHHLVTGGSGTEVVTFSGAAAGTLAIIVVSGFGVAASTPAGWTFVYDYTWSFGYHTATYSKVLASGDIATGSVSVSGCGAAGNTVMETIYSGVTAASIVSLGENTGPSIPMPGFTKSAGCKGIVAHCTSRDVGTILGAPGTTINRISQFSGANFTSRLDDILNPANYVNGSTLSYTSSTPFFDAVAQMLELT